PVRAQDEPAADPQPVDLADPPAAEDIPEQPEAGAEPTVKALSASTFSALRARAIGPALMSGRISDIAVNPNDHSEMYVSAASGGVWKSANRGVSFSPVFDGEGSYSIGCL